jgi:hypothetical protein
MLKASAASARPPLTERPRALPPFTPAPERSLPELLSSTLVLVAFAAFSAGLGTGYALRVLQMHTRRQRFLHERGW